MRMGLYPHNPPRAYSSHLMSEQQIVLHARIILLIVFILATMVWDCYTCVNPIVIDLGRREQPEQH